MFLPCARDSVSTGSREEEKGEWSQMHAEGLIGNLNFGGKTTGAACWTRDVACSSLLGCNGPRFAATEQADK